VSRLKKLGRRLSVLQLDAHGDLRDSYEGTPFSHACVMRRIVPQADLVQVGIRAISVEEQRFLKRSRDTITTIFAEELEGGDAWMDRALGALGDDVYLTVDVDFFDPSLVPSTGTPEPYQFEAFIPAIEAGIRCGAILTTHEYGAPTMYLWWSQGLPPSYGHPEVPAYSDRGPLIGRYRFLYYNVLLPRGLNIPLVISETGIDGGAGAGQRPGYSNAQGWMGFWDYWGAELGVTDPAQFYVDQLAWYDSLLRQDSFVIGATIFNVAGGSNPTWASFEASPIIPKLTDYALSLK